MNQPLAFVPVFSIVLFALTRVRHLLGLLDEALQRRSVRRTRAASAISGAVPHALLGLWGASQAALMAAPSRPLSAPVSPARAAAPSNSSTLVRTGRVVWRALERAGARRARRELLNLAREHEAARPEFAAHLREAAHRGWL